jgi:uncharacterized membrane protein
MNIKEYLLLSKRRMGVDHTEKGTPKLPAVTKLPLLMAGTFFILRWVSRKAIFGPNKSRRLKGTREVIVHRSFTVCLPRAEVYTFWHNYRHYPAFRSPRSSFGYSSSWIAEAPLHRKKSMEPKLTEQCEGELIAWEAAAKTGVTNSGKVEFYDSPLAYATEVRVTLRYSFENETKAFSQDVCEKSVDQELMEFKKVMESSLKADVNGPKSSEDEAECDPIYSQLSYSWMPG